MLLVRLYFVLVFIVFLSLSSFAEDGSRLWLRYEKVGNHIVSKRKIQTTSKNPIVLLAKRELDNYWAGSDVKLLIDPKQSKLKDGYRIKSLDKKALIVVACEPVGLLYAAYHLLKGQELDQNFLDYNIEEIPSYDIRILNHWDNLDGTVERGYAGYSLWKWDELPQITSSRYEQYARANASIGINACVLNNVNASPDILKDEYLIKVKALADVFRLYGIRVYLSVNFSSPKLLGGLVNSDPLNSEVQQWWKGKTKEIYQLIPDFGGFLVKANSEGQPGPQDYGRTHADGANMLADVLAPYQGVVMWRAFVYNPTEEDRAKQAHQQFVPLDGQFRDNVIIQIKNGPIDFQPREPFTPLFGAMPRTAQMVEFQITQEYLGFSNHLVYLAPLFKETLDSDTYSKGVGTTVAKVSDGTISFKSRSAIAGVANIGENANWTGHHFGQANWYAFGRLAWNHRLTSEDIAKEWVQLTFTKEDTFVDEISKILLASRETAVDYMMPLGLHHIFAFDHHYGPEPWGDIPGGRADWMPWYYHKADTLGIGFDRTMSGSKAVEQYNEPLRSVFSNIRTCPENLLLWFHHVPWDYQMNNGNTLWEELCTHYDKGVNRVREFQRVWDRMEIYVDKNRFNEIQSKLKIQSKDAVWWKDACLLYFQTFSKQPIPFAIDRPIYELEDLKKIKLPLKHHN